MTINKENHESATLEVDLRGTSEIMILPDGRIYIHGLSRCLKELLEAMDMYNCPHPDPLPIRQWRMPGEGDFRIDI